MGLPPEVQLIPPQMDTPGDLIKLSIQLLTLAPESD